MEANDSQLSMRNTEFLTESVAGRRTYYIVKKAKGGRQIVLRLCQLGRTEFRGDYKSHRWRFHEMMYSI